MSKPKAEDEGHERRDIKTRFQTGNSGGGRKPGSRNKLGQEFIEALADEFEEHGREAISRLRASDPATFLKIIGNVLPKQLETSVTVSVFSSEQLQNAADFAAAWKLVRRAQEYIGVDPSRLIEVESERRDAEFDND
jgi:hypothetical protein